MKEVDVFKTPWQLFFIENRKYSIFLISSGYKAPYQNLKKNRKVTFY